jgi:hypothetical protein
MTGSSGRTSTFSPRCAESRSRILEPPRRRSCGFWRAGRPLWRSSPRRLQTRPDVPLLLRLHDRSQSGRIRTAVAAGRNVPILQQSRSGCSRPRLRSFVDVRGRIYPLATRLMELQRTALNAIMTAWQCGGPRGLGGGRELVRTLRDIVTLSDSQMWGRRQVATAVLDHLFDHHCVLFRAVHTRSPSFRMPLDLRDWTSADGHGGAARPPATVAEALVDGPRCGSR